MDKDFIIRKQAILNFFLVVCMASVAKCNICYEKKEVLVPTSTCSHDAGTCMSCIQESLKMNMNGGSLAICSDITKIPCCGGFNCKEHFEEKDLRNYLDKQQMAKWNDLAFQAFAKKQDDFRWCSEPSCGSGQFVDGGLESNTFFKCHKCRKMTCVRHRIPMHVGISCFEYDMIGTDYSRTMDEIAKSSKPCPACGEAVLKSDGCDHMTCLCGYQFCYRCLADWKLIITNDNSYHNPGCEWYFVNDE